MGEWESGREGRETEEGEEKETEEGRSGRRGGRHNQMVGWKKTRKTRREDGEKDGSDNLHFTPIGNSLRFPPTPFLDPPDILIIPHPHDAHITVAVLASSRASSLA